MLVLICWMFLNIMLKDVNFNVEEIYSDGIVKKRNTIYDLSKINDFNKHSNT